MPVFNENGATQVPSATAEFAFMETGDNSLKNCTPSQIATAINDTAYLPNYGLPTGGDDTSIIQGVIDSGVGIIDTGSNHEIYKVTRIVGRSNITFTGNGTFDFSGNSSYATSSLDPLILFQGEAGSPVLLTADATPSAITLTVTSTSGFSARDLVEIATPGDNGGFIDASIAVHNGELLEVSTVDSATQLTLRGSILDLNGYTVANGAQIRKITPVENITIGKDITIKGKGRPQPSGTGDYGVVVHYGRRIDIHCRIVDVDSRAVYLNSCFDYTVSNMEITHPIKGTSTEPNYGICPAGSSKYGEIAHNRLVNQRHAVVSSHLSSSVGDFYGVSRVTKVHNNTAINCWHAGFSTHNDTELIEFFSNTAINCTFGFNARDRRVSIIENTSIDCGQHILLTIRPSKLTVSRNKCYRGGYILTSTSVEANNDFDDWTIVGNEGFNSYGIYVFGATPVTSHKRLVVKGNIIRSSPGEGGNSAAIRVNGAFLGPQIAENVVMVNANGAGIRVEGVTDAEIMRNTVRDVSGVAYVFSSITNTIAKGNTAKGYGTFSSGSTGLVNTATFLTDNTDMGA